VRMYSESILIGAGFVMIIFAVLLHLPQKKTVPQNQITQSSVRASDARVEFYRRQIGDRLNAERLNTQFENIHSKPAPPAKYHQHHEAVLQGAPLEGERHPYEKMVKADPEKETVEGEIEGYVAYTRNLRDWEEHAKAQYIAEFMARAESLGYRVQIDRNYNVFYEYVGGERAPQSITLNVPLSILAPSCPIR
jgi:hypothetical protein